MSVRWLGNTGAIRMNGVYSARADHWYCEECGNKFWSISEYNAKERSNVVCPPCNSKAYDLLPWWSKMLLKFKWWRQRNL